MTQVPILETLLHPPLGLLQRELITGVFSGSGDLDRTAPGVGVNAYGLTFDLFTLPAGWGSYVGNPTVYVPDLVQLSTIHTGFDSHELISEYHSFGVEGLYWLWENPFPTRIHYEIAPGVELTFFWLVL